MNGGGKLLGLRILFGAKESMVIPGAPRSFSNWTKFCEMFLKFNSLSAAQAISIFRSIYGSNRPVLLLVDEISKASFINTGIEGDICAAREIMKEIGVVLDLDGNTDVVLSSLSPQYVQTLVSRNSQVIEYCVFLPLLDVNLVGDICKKWKDRLMKKYMLPGKIDEFSQCLS